MSSIMEISNSKPIGVSPVAVFSLSEDLCTHARISIESKTSVYDPRKIKDSPERAISLSITIRQYPQNGIKFNAIKSFESQCLLLENLMEDKIVPYFARPLISAIAHRRLT